MTIQLTKKIESTEKVDLPVPCFFRDKSETNYIGLLDSDTVVTIYRNSDLLMIQNTKLYVKEQDLVKARQTMLSCTESEFFEAYADVEQKMSLHPILSR